MLSWLLETVGATSKEYVGAEVSLTIYEMPGASKLHNLTQAAALGSAYHIGVSVYWLEWSFGWCRKGTGVYMVHPGENSLGIFKESVPLGRTPYSPQQVIDLLQELRDGWHGTDYHLLTQSCAHFSVEFAKRLDVQNAPEWLDSLASVGDHVIKRLGKKKAAQVVAAVTPKPERRLPPEMADFGLEVGPHADELEERECAWKRACEFILEHSETAESGRPWEELAVELRWNATAFDGEDFLNASDELARDHVFQAAITRAAWRTLRCEEEDAEFLGARATPPASLRIRLRVRLPVGEDFEESRRPSPQAFARSFREHLLQVFDGDYQVVVPQGQVPLGDGRVGHAGDQATRASRLSQALGPRRSSLRIPSGPMVLTSGGTSAPVLLPNRMR